MSTWYGSAGVLDTEVLGAGVHSQFQPKALIDKKGQVCKAVPLGMIMANKKEIIR